MTDDAEQRHTLVIVVTDAVVDPGAMVVHFHHTAAADRAVMGAVGLDDPASCADPEAFGGRPCFDGQVSLLNAQGNLLL